MASKNFTREDIINNLNSADSTLRHNAIIAAGELYDPEINAIIEKLCVASDPATRYFAKKTIKKIKDSLQKNEPEIAASSSGTNIDTLKALLSSADPQNRQRALKALSIGFNMEALPLIINMLKNEKDPFVIASLVKLVGKYGGTEHIDRLSVFLNHDDPRVRANAIEGLELAGTEKIIAYIVPFINDPDNRIKANAVKALSKFRADEMLEVLGGMIKSDQLWMKDSAIFALQHIASDTAVNILCTAVEDAEKSISNNAMQALIKIGSAYALEKVDNYKRALTDTTVQPSIKKTINTSGEQLDAALHSEPVKKDSAREPDENKKTSGAGTEQPFQKNEVNAAPAVQNNARQSSQTISGGAENKNEGAFEKLKANIGKKETSLINIIKGEDSQIMANFKIDLEDNFTSYVNEIKYVSLAVTQTIEKKKPVHDKIEPGEDITSGGTLKPLNSENAAKLNNEAKKRMILDSLKGGKSKKK